MNTYLDDGTPSFKKQTVKLKNIPAYQYDVILKDSV